MKKALSLVLCFVLVAVMALPVFAAEYTVGDDGNAVYDNAHGYVFGVDSVNGTVNETVVVLNSQEAFDACASVWSIYILLNKVEENVYIAAEDAFVAKGSKPAYTLGEGDIVLVSHSSSSRPTDAETYPNWQDKVAAVAVKAGDYFTFSGVDFAAGTVAEGATVACTAEKPAAPGGETVVIENQKVSGITYTTSQLFRQNNSTWSWDENCEIAYPDSGNELFDGVFAPTETHHLYDANAGAWMGFHAQCPDYEEVGYAWIKLDLGKAYDLTDVALYTASSAVDYANATVVTVRVSADGNEWADFGSVDCVDDASVTFVKTTVSGAANARYVEIRMTTGGGWLGVCEAEVFADVAVSGGSTTIKEEITVDGDVNDTGWAKDKWISVDGVTGYWQNSYDISIGTQTAPTFGYKYQIRADETKLYVAFVIDGEAVPGGNGNGTFPRLWIRDNDEATIYTSFFNAEFKEDGSVSSHGKYNTSLTENKSCYIGQTDPTATGTPEELYIGSLEVAAKEVDGKCVFEFSVDIAEFSEDGTFDYFVSVHQVVADGKASLLHPAVEIGPISDAGGDAHMPNKWLPYTVWHTEKDATINVEDIALGEVVVSDKEEADTSMMGTAPTDPAFTVTLDTAEGWVAGEKLVVNATVDILADIDLSQVLFNLYYDAADVEIVLPEELGDIITTGKDSWKEDSLFTLKTEGDYGVIECAPATTVEEDVLKKGEQLVMTFEFTVKEDAEGLINFQLSNKGLVGYSWDLDAAEAAGAGSSLAVENADELGDTGIYVIAALALVALIGTAIVIKKRA